MNAAKATSIGKLTSVAEARMMRWSFAFSFVASSSATKGANDKPNITNGTVISRTSRFAAP